MARAKYHNYAKQIALHGGVGKVAALCGISKCSGLITKTEQLTAYFLQSSTALSFMYLQRALEELGYPRMTTETLEFSTKVYLAKKGVSDNEDIRKLENLAGYLTCGLVLLLQCLPRTPGHLESGPGSR